MLIAIPYIFFIWFVLFHLSREKKNMFFIRIPDIRWKIPDIIRPLSDSDGYHIYHIRFYSRKKILKFPDISDRNYPNPKKGLVGRNYPNHFQP